MKAVIALTATALVTMFATFPQQAVAKSSHSSYSAKSSYSDSDRPRIGLHSGMNGPSEKGWGGGGGQASRLRGWQGAHGLHRGAQGARARGDGAMRRRRPVDTLATVG
jgi:hypothetical protein